MRKQIDELSKKTLSSYIKNAAMAVGTHAYTGGKHQGSGMRAKWKETQQTHYYSLFQEQDH